MRGLRSLFKSFESRVLLGWSVSGAIKMSLASERGLSRSWKNHVRAARSILKAFLGKPPASVGPGREDRQGDDLCCVRSRLVLSQAVMVTYGHDRG